jgi:hypothetical protein
MTAGTGYLGEVIRDRTARTGQLERTVGRAIVAGHMCWKETCLNMTGQDN